LCPSNKSEYKYRYSIIRIKLKIVYVLILYYVWYIITARNNAECPSDRHNNIIIFHKYTAEHHTFHTYTAIPEARGTDQEITFTAF